MDLIPKTLADQLPANCVRTNTRATQVMKRTAEDGYRITVMKREAGEQYTPLEFTCLQIVLAAPPFALRGLDVAKDMQPALYSVHERRGGHVYARCKANTANVPDRSDDDASANNRIYQNLPDSILQQVISGDYGGGVFQAAYATDRFERVWREVQYQGPDAVMRQVKEHLNRISSSSRDSLLLPNVEWDDAIEEVYVRLLFVHRWQNEAHVNGKNKIELSLQAITPNPYRLPGLYLVGEAFSPFQGWTEGAVWTADKAVDIIVKARQSNGVYDNTTTHNDSMSQFSAKKKLETDDTGKILGDVMVYRGLVVDVSDWVERHPGGRGMILGHKGEDLSELFDNFHPGWPNALATIFGLQIGTTD
jgi:Cytochrome b5-like Heme/Steroid binding domain